MKTILLIAYILIIASCASHDGYLLTGKVPEAWEGKTVLLMLSDVNQPYSIDSTKVSGSQFQFKGKFDLPRYCHVVIYLNSGNRQDSRQIITFPVFIDSTAIEAICDNTGKEPKFTISGSKTQDTYQDYQNQLASYQTARSTVFSEYTKAYYYEQNLPKAIDLTKKVSAKAEETRAFQKQYMKEHPGSVISLSIAQKLCDRNSTLSLSEMEELFTTLSPQLQNAEMGKSLRETIQTKQVILGQPYLDKELIAPDGSLKKISDLVKPGHHTLIEFWASWCAPCRAEFPHIRKTYEKYHPKGFDIINISIDRDPQAWLKAIEEEKLTWSQLRDIYHRKNPEASAFKAYNLTGVPSSILLDDKGRMISFNARGGWLDSALQEIYD